MIDDISISVLLLLLLFVEKSNCRVSQRVGVVERRCFEKQIRSIRIGIRKVFFAIVVVVVVC
jgi:hypothetical protein